MPIFQAGSASVSIVPDFKGAQKRIGEWFASQGDMHVGVKPDVNDGDMARVRAELGALSGTATVNVDRSKLRSDLSTAITDAFKGATGLSDFGKLLTSSVRPALMVGLGGLAAELAAPIGAAVGGGLALLPAAIVGLAAPLAAVAVGVHGLSDAFKALSTGDITKIQQTMDKLAPSARDFVTQVHALGPAWSALRLDVQQHLFSGLGDSVTQLAHVALPVLRTGLSNIASSLNSGLVLTMGQLAKDGPQFTNIFKNVNTAVGDFATQGLPKLVQLFVTFANVGSQFLPQIIKGLDNLISRFSDFINKIAASGQLAQIMQTAIDIFKQLFAIVGNVGGIIANIFKAALPFGQQLLGLLQQLTGGLKTFLGTDAAQSSLKTFFGDITGAVATLLPSLETLIQVIVVNVLPAVGEFLKALAPVAALLAGALADALAQITKLFPPLADVVAGLIGAFSPLIPVISQIIQDLLPPLLKVGKELIPVISDLTSAFGQALLDAVKAVAPFIQPIADGFIQVLKAVTPALPALGHLAKDVLPPLLGGVKDLVNFLVPILVPILKKLADHANLVVEALVAWKAAQILLDAVAAFQKVGGIAGIVIRIGEWASKSNLVAGATKIWAAAQWLLNGAMDANPIALIILGIAALVAIVLVVVTHLKFFKRIWDDVWDALKTAFHATIDFIVQHWRLLLLALPVVGPIIDGIIYVIQHFHQIWQAVLDAITTAWHVVWSAIRDWFEANIIHWFSVTFVNFFTQTIPHWWETAWHTVRDFFVGLWTDITGWVQTHIIDWFTGTFVHFFTQTIPDAFRGAWNGIRDFFVGLWTGLVGWFSTALGNFGDFFTKFWKGLKEGVAGIWHDILHALEAPVQTVINWVWNDTLRPAWNLLNNLWGGTDLPPVTLPGLSAADGAVLPGFTPGQDVHHFFSPTAGALHLSGGEAIMRPEFTAAVGHHWVDRMNTAARAGGTSGVQAAMSFAEGGVWPNADWAGHIPRGDRSLGWISGLEGAFSWILNLIPGGNIVDSLTKYLLAESQASNDQGASPWFSALGGITRNGLNSLWTVIKDSISGLLNSTAAANPRIAGPGPSHATGPVVDIVRAAAAAYGWNTGSEWDALVGVVNRESGFRPTAQNPTSTAYGIFQFLNSTWASVGGAKTSDPGLQADYGMRYIHQRYHDPLGALAHEQNFGWFDQGGYLPPGWSTVYNGTGRHELVLNPQQQSAIGQRLAGGGGLHVGGISIAMQTANPYEVADELVYRMRVASRGGVYSTVRG